MKKCPYCAEKIQDEAIVCRYCGRDLPKTKEMPKGKAPSKSVETASPQASIWVQGAKGSAVLTVFYVLNQFIETQTTNNLIFRLTIGVLVTFFLFWLICSGIVWSWRRFGISGLIWLITIVGLFIAIAVSRDLAPDLGFSFIEPTPTTKPTSTPMSTDPILVGERIPLLTPATNVSNCKSWTDIVLADHGKENCVYGVVVKAEENFNTMFHPEPFLLSEPCASALYCGLTIDFSVPTDANNNYFFVTTNTLYEVKIGDCILAIGPVSYITSAKNNNVRSIRSAELFACPPALQ